MSASASACRQRALSEIRTIASGLWNLRDIAHAAEALFVAGDFSAAADLYVRIATEDKDTLPLRRLLVSLNNSGRRGEARALFERVPQPLQETPRYAELGSVIYQNSGLLDRAKSLLETAIAADPEDLETRLAWMNAAERLGRIDEVAAWLSSLPVSLEGTPDHLMQIATAMDRLGVQEPVLPLAYRALRAGYNDPGIHSAYMIGLFLIGRVGRRDIPTPEATGPDVAVTLSEVDGDRTLTYVFDTEQDPRIERQEIGAENPLWASLAGLRVGDEVELSKLGPASTFKVTGLADKYLHAHFRSMAAFPTLFPSDKTLGAFSFDPENPIESFAPLLEAAQDRADFSGQLESYYRSGSLPLAMFAKFAGRSGFEIWDSVTGDQSDHPAAAVPVGADADMARTDHGQRMQQVIDEVLEIRVGRGVLGVQGAQPTQVVGALLRGARRRRSELGAQRG